MIGYSNVGFFTWQQLLSVKKQHTVLLSHPVLGAHLTMRKTHKQ